MRERKLLAEWFWTDRWIGSSGFLLPMEPRGLYREMLTQSWRRGGTLPNNPEAIRRATGCTVEEWDRAWPTVAIGMEKSKLFSIFKTQNKPLSLQKLWGRITPPLQNLRRGPTPPAPNPSSWVGFNPSS